MVTTIQVKESTRQMLEYLKGKGTYDEAIVELMKKQGDIPPSLHGSYKGLTWKKSDRMKFDGE